MTRAEEQDKQGGYELYGYPPISDFGLIGDCHTAALVGRDGSIDWYCPGRFDAPAALCRMLDRQKGGFFRVGPTVPAESKRRYLPHSPVLQTTFTTEQGEVRLTDCMPVQARDTHRGASHQGTDVTTRRHILRLVEGVRGSVDVAVELKVSFDYARRGARLRPGGHGRVLVEEVGGDGRLTLITPGLEMEEDDSGRLHAVVHVRAGDRFWLGLAEGHVDREIDPSVADEQLAETRSYWQGWTNACRYHGAYREQVLRSAITLKLLTYEPSGAIVAAPTTSLPEQLGGVRNWDYRFTWLRDSTLILYALSTIGYSNEAADFLRWARTTFGRPDVGTPQIMYRVDGDEQIPEKDLPHLEGYALSRPVRVGNAASKQRQMDIYGEVLRAAYVHFRRPGAEEKVASESRGAGRRPGARTWAFLRHFVDIAAKEWRNPDSGLWESRGKDQPFLYSKLMCWAALDRGLRLAEEHGLPAPRQEWEQTRKEIRQAILTEGYNEDVGAFTQAFGSRELDASALAVPRIGFLPPRDPRVLSTVRAIRQNLVHNGLVYRYHDTDDGLPKGEATFTLCSFWMVEALALAGEVDQARELFEHVLSFGNDLGLFAEEIQAATGEQLGNFPQGFTHLGLIGAAVDLARAARQGAEREPTTEAERAHRSHEAVTGPP